VPRGILTHEMKTVMFLWGPTDITAVLPLV